MKNLVLFYVFLLSLPVIGQTNISLSTVAGLAKTKRSYGTTYAIRGGITFNKLNIEAGYYYSDMQQELQSAEFRIYKYSLTAGYAIFDSDRRFKFTANMGPALIHATNSGSTDFGLDINLSLGYKFFNFLSAEMGISNTISDNQLIQSFVGFRYNIK